MTTSCRQDPVPLATVSNGFTGHMSNGIVILRCIFATCWLQTCCHICCFYLSDMMWYLVCESGRTTLVTVQGLVLWSGAKVLGHLHLCSSKGGCTTAYDHSIRQQTEHLCERCLSSGRLLHVPDGCYALPWGDQAGDYHAIQTPCL